MVSSGNESVFDDEILGGVGHLGVAPVVGWVAHGPAVGFEVLEVEVVSRSDGADGVAEVVGACVVVAFFA